DDVVDHARELVHAVHGDGLPGGAQAQPRLLEAVDGARAVVGPHDVGEDAEEPVEVEPVRHDEAVGQQVQAQVRVGGVRGRGVEVDLGAHDDDVDAAYLVALGEGVERGGGGRVGRRGDVGRGGGPEVTGLVVR